MTTPLRFERRTLGVYPYLFHAGAYYWPASLDAVAALKSSPTEDPQLFEARLLDAVAPTRYLRRQLESVLAGLEDRAAALRRLQESLAGL